MDIRELPDWLERIARDVRSGDWTESSAAVFLTHSADGRIMTISPFGNENAVTELLKEALEGRPRRQ